MGNIQLFKDRKGVTSLVGVMLFLILLLVSFFTLVMVQYGQSQYRSLLQDMKALDLERENEKLVFYRVGFDDYIPANYTPAQGVEVVAGNLESLWRDDNSFLTFSSAASGGFVSGEYEPTDGGELGNTSTITGGYSNLADKDGSYWQLRSYVSPENTTTAYHPSGYNLLGSTTYVSGSFSDLQADDGVYMTFRSYYTGTNVEDFVDNNTSDVDSSPDVGTHSNFSAQKAGPDGVYDTLTEESTELIMEWGTVSVGDTFVTVNLSFNYTDPIIVGAAEYSSGIPRTVRITDINATSFKVRVQNPSGQTTPITTVHYIVVEEGVWTLPDGRKMEVSKYATNTVGENNNWAYDLRNYRQTYSGNIVVLHQVMSYNDANWITTYVSKSNSRSSPPSSADSNFRIALNGAEAVDSHGTEIIGYIIIEEGYGTLNGIKYEVRQTADFVRGFDNNPPYNTAFLQSFSAAPAVLVSAQLEMDGGNGGWCIDYAITQTNAGLAIDEDQVSDSERSHITETCGFWVFETAGSYGTPNYRLDLEEQFTGVDYSQENEELCIYVGSTGAEDIVVQYWTGSAWSDPLFTDLTPNSWNNVSVSLTTSTFTIRFTGGTETGDMVQDSWQIDAVLLHVWTDQYTMEVEFTGSSNMFDWRELTWKVDSAWTVGSVDVTIQLYNYTLGGYPTSGNGYIFYTSSASPNTDETVTQPISANSTDFRDGSGNWKMRIKGVKYTSVQFDWKGDLVEFETTYPSGYAVDWYADFYAPVQGLYNFSIQYWGYYTEDNVGQTIYTYNYRTGQYDSIDSATYTTAYSGQWRNVTVTENVSDYILNGNIRIRVKGEVSTNPFDVFADYLHLNETHYTSGALNWYGKIPVNQTASEIDRFDVTYIGYFSNEAELSIYIYNFTASRWDELATVTASTIETLFGPLPVNGSDVSHYINSFQEVWVSINSTSSKPYYCYADYLHVKVYPHDFTPPWWNAKYHYRKQVTVSNNATSALEEGYSVKLTVDTASLVSANKMISNGTDLRIAWWNTTAAGWVELDRDVISMNTSSTEVWFKTQSTIPQNETDSNYFMYYGNPYAVNPPENRSNVYLWFDSFETDTRSQYSIGRHATDWHGSGVYTDFGYDSENERITYDTDDNYVGGLMPNITEDDVYAEMKMGVTGSYPINTTQGILIRWQSNTVFYGVKATGGDYTPKMGIVENSRTNDLASNNTAYHPVDGSTFKLGVAMWSNNIKMWYGDDTYSYQVWASTTDSSITTAGKIDFLAAQSIGWMDDLLIRKYIEPEPSTSLGAEESTWIGYVLLKLTNEGNKVVHLESLMVIDDANHEVVSLENAYISPKETWSYQIQYSWVSDATYTIKAVSDRGNTWSYTTRIR